MSWAKLDDGMPDDVKIADLSDTAFRGYVTGICYAARKLTDGYIPLSVAKKLTTPRAIKELVPDSWHVTPHLCDECAKRPEAVAAVALGVGFYVHQYLKYNFTREKVEADREQAQGRMKRLRSPEHPANNDGTSGEVRLPHPTPSQSLPIPLDGGGGRRGIYVLYEDCYGPIHSGVTEELKALEDEHPPACIEHCFAKTKLVTPRPKSLGYTKAMLERHRREGCESAPPRTPVLAGRKSDLYDE